MAIRIIFIASNFVSIRLGEGNEMNKKEKNASIAGE